LKEPVAGPEGGKLRGRPAFYQIHSALQKKTDFFNEPNPSSLGLRIPFPDPHRPLPPVVVDAVVPLAVLGQDGEPLAGLILAAASLLKDTANRIGDLVDDGRVNRSFKS